MSDRPTDLAGPGIGDYDELRAILPADYRPLQTARRRVEALWAVRRFFEDRLCEALNLTMVPVPLIVDAHSGMNDNLDRDGSRTPVGFHIANDHDQHPVDAEVVQAATKWKRFALQQFGFEVGEGLCTDMRAVRKDYFLDHDHSAYVDQWDWEKVIAAEDRTLATLRSTVTAIWSCIKAASDFALVRFPELGGAYPPVPDEIAFVHAEDLLARYPDLSRKERETALLREHAAVFLIGIGATLADGHPHELRAADYDDWISPTTSADGRPMHGLNGDILVWNPVTERRHELSSMGIRVTAETLLQQLRATGLEHYAKLPYHRMILDGEVPLSIGGGIGMSRTLMYLLRTAHIGEVSVTVWPDVLKQMCAERGIHVLE